MIEQAASRLWEFLLSKWSPMDFTVGVGGDTLFVYMHRRGMFGGEEFEGFPVRWVYMGRCELN